MLHSKLIRSITIVNSKQTFEISTDQDLANMIKRVAKVVFNDEDFYINESIMLGILYDDQIFSHLQIAVNNSYFYECKDLETITKIAGGDAKVYKDLLEDTIEFLKDHRNLLESDKRTEYEDLAISQFGRAAKYLDHIKISVVRTNVLVDQLIAAMKKVYTTEDLKDKETARNVLRALAVYCQIKDFAFFITEDNRYNVLVRDTEISDRRVAKFKECIDRMFECDATMIKERELSDDEYLKIFNIMVARDTILISACTFI